MPGGVGKNLLWPPTSARMTAYPWRCCEAAFLGLPSVDSMRGITEKRSVGLPPVECLPGKGWVRRTHRARIWIGPLPIVGGADRVVGGPSGKKGRGSFSRRPVERRRVFERIAHLLALLCDFRSDGSFRREPQLQIAVGRWDPERCCKRSASSSSREEPGARPSGGHLEGDA